MYFFHGPNRTNRKGNMITPETESTEVDTLKIALGNKKKICVLFYSPKCGYCMKMANEWNDFAKDPGTGVQAISVNITTPDTQIQKITRRLVREGGTDAESLSAAVGKGVPAIVRFNGRGDGELFGGPRTADALRLFCRDMSRGALSINASALRDVLRGGSPTMINFHRPGCPPCERLAQEYSILAKALCPTWYR